MLLHAQHPLDTFRAIHLHKLWILLLTIVVCLLSTISWALDSDRGQPLEISADQAELNEGEGFSIYSGNVVITQGTMNIEASSVKVTFNDDGIETLLATDGHHDGLAYMSQQSEPNAEGASEVMKAWGKTIDYQVSAEYLTLLGRAKLIQQGNQFSGHEIIFDIPKDKVKATGGEGKRVNMIFLPKSN